MQALVLLVGVAIALVVALNVFFLRSGTHRERWVLALVVFCLTSLALFFVLATIRGLFPA